MLPIVGVAAASTAVVVIGPTNMAHSATSVGRVANDLFSAGVDLANAARNRDPSYLGSFLWNVVKAPIHAVDAVLYLIPIVGSVRSWFPTVK